MDCISGVVNEDGETLFGSGFRASRLSAGLFEIVFDEPFPVPPAITATVYGTQPNGDDWDIFDNVEVRQSAESRAVLRTGGSTDGVPPDRPFSFEASVTCGPQAPVPVQGSVVSGWISARGTIEYGSGFTVTRLDQGFFRVTFDIPFPRVPVVLLNLADCVQWYEPQDRIALQAWNEGYFQVVTGVAQAVYDWKPFRFIAAC